MSNAYAKLWLIRLIPVHVDMWNPSSPVVDRETAAAAVPETNCYPRLRAMGGRSVLRLCVLTLLSVGLLSLASAPVGLWFLSWIGLLPLLIAVADAPTIRASLGLGWLGGVAYFGVNIWWLWTASLPGTVVLVLYFALFWALAAVLIRGLKLLPPNRLEWANSGRHSGGNGRNHGERWTNIYRVFGIATVWVATEWLRCNLLDGFAWLPLGCSQSPVAFMCQVADIGGPWIVSFWVVLINAVVAIAWLERGQLADWLPSTCAVISVFAAVACYGIWRLDSTPSLPGPRVMVIQSNFPHLPGGAPTVDHEHAVDYFLGELMKDLTENPADLVVMPEAAFPPINKEARHELAHARVGPFLEATYQRLMRVAHDHHTALLVGGNAVTGWSVQGSAHIGAEIRNCAYFIDPNADRPMQRYDKIYLARFSERAPLTVGPQWLRRLAAFISAPRAVQPLFAGQLRDLRPFRLTWDGAQDTAEFITPICLENIDPAVVAQIGPRIACAGQASRLSG